MQRAVVEDPAFGVEAACHPHRRIGIEKALRFAGQPLRAADQQVGIRQRKEIRALPHVAGVRQAVYVVPGNLAHQAPLTQVAGGKQQHFAALLHILRPKNHVPAPVLPPHFRVAHMAGIAFWQRQHRPQLAEGAIGILGRQTLPGGAPAVGEFHVAGVAQSQGALELDRAARVAAVAVILFIRHQGDRFVPPVQQIGRAPVSPALIGMVAGERVPLIKQVVTPGDLAKAVRIVQQSVDRRQMPLRIMAVGQRLRLALHNGLQDRRQA